MITWLPLLAFFAAPLGTDPDLYWHFPIMVLVGNLVYSATRYDDPVLILRHAFKGVVYIATFLGTVFGILFVVANFL